MAQTLNCPQKQTSHGLLLEPLEFDHSRHNGVVVCFMTPSGLVPFRVALPHQLYKDALDTALAGHPEATGIFILPYNSTNGVQILHKHGLQEP